MTARDTARAAMERHYVEVLEIDLDRCTLTYGVAPCTASGAVGTECYNTYQTCQAKAAYTKGSHTYKFISRGAPIPPGELVRPYIEDISTAPTVAEPGEGLARRAKVTIKLADEPDSDVEQDPYVANRAHVNGTELQWTGNGTRTVFQLPDYYSSTGLNALYKTDWQGRQLQHDTPRTNLLTYSEFPNGVTDAPTRGGLISASTMDGFSGAIAFGHDGVTVSYAYKSLASATLTTHIFSVFVKMDDGLPPSFGSSTIASVLNSFWIKMGLIGSGGINPTTYKVTEVGGGLYRVDVSAAFSALPIYCGVAKYATNSPRTFKVTGYQLEEVASVTPYIPTAATAVTVTDYTISGTNITMAVAPDAGAVLGADFGRELSVPTFWRRLFARNRNYAGRVARVLRGYAVSPWDWNTFQTERYIIDASSGPDKSGAVTLTLKDPIALADKVKVPVPTDGKLLAVLPDYEQRGYAQSGSTASTIVLNTEASATDDYYNGMAVRIDDQTGAGQERVISDYVGATRTATVSSNWAVTPDNTSLYSIHHLQVTLETGKGAQYDAYGYPCHVRFGEEIIKVTSRATDTLKWGTSADRAQYNTALKEHRASEVGQLCKVYANTPITDVIINLANDAGITSTYIDTAMLAEQESTWFGDAYRISVALSAPENVSTYIKELGIEANSLIWWSPVVQKLRLMAIMPVSPAAPAHLTDEAAVIDGSLDVQRLDEQRLTAAAVYYDLINATAERVAKNYLAGEIYVDADAESANEYNDNRTSIIYSRWFGAANDQAALDLASRTISGRRNPPIKVSFRVDPKDFDFDVGDQRDVTVPEIVDTAGNPKKTRLLITRYDDKGHHVAVEARTTDFGKRWAFIAPDGTADYPSETDYAHICLDTGLMSDGESGYLII